jgi:hypothetical protein
MTDKMPVVGKRYRHKEKGYKVTILRVVAGTDFIIYDVDLFGQSGVDKHRFLEIFEELPTSNPAVIKNNFSNMWTKKDQERIDKTCYLPTEEQIKLMQQRRKEDRKEEVSEVEKALEEVKDQLKWNDYYLCPKRLDREEIEQIRFKRLNDLNKKAQNLVNALEAEKNQKKSGLNAIFPNAEYVYSESSLDIPEPTITFQTPDQPELGFNSPTWSNISKSEPEINRKERSTYCTCCGTKILGVIACASSFKSGLFCSAKCANMKENCVEPVSIWKDVSELPKDHLEKHGEELIALKVIFGGKANFVTHVDMIRHGKGMTLTDFVNQVEDMEARLRKLEGK